jgi:lipopolysaccharide transport system permease protein
MPAILDHEATLEGNRLIILCRFDSPVTAGCHWINPADNRFLRESPWAEAPTGQARFEIDLPPIPGAYRFFVSHKTKDPQNQDHWAYLDNEPMLVVDLSLGEDTVENFSARLLRREELPERSRFRLLAELFLAPFRMIWSHRQLIATLVERDILARYRGSIADAFWAVLNPLILMLTYFFIFGIVLETRFPGDASRFGFGLYFLAGMLPWLAFSEAIARAPNHARENRNFITRLIFPVEILPLNLCLSGLVTGIVALLIFLGFLLASRGAIPPTAAYLPLILLPQLLFTAGLSYALFTLGVFARDLVYIVSLGLTLWFFLTPICYPETSLPKTIAPFLELNPILVLVRAYRATLVEGTPPDWPSLIVFTALSVLLFYAGFVYFWRTRKSFADAL